MSFTIFQNQKMPFQAIKTRGSKSQKIEIIPKGLTQAFGAKMAIFQTIGPQNAFYDILVRENFFLGYKNNKFKKSKNWHFSKGVNQCFCSKIGHFPNFIFQALQARKICFTIFQNEKTPFQDIKTRSLKCRKIDIFPKGLTHCFGSKMAIFQTFFFKAIWVRKMSYAIILNEKTPFQAIKTRSSKGQKIDIFSKGLTYGFDPKMGIFPKFFFLGNKGLENVVYDILERKSAFLVYKKKKFKKSKN